MFFRHRPPPLGLRRVWCLWCVCYIGSVYGRGSGQQWGSESRGGEEVSDSPDPHHPHRVSAVCHACGVCVKLVVCVTGPVGSSEDLSREARVEVSDRAQTPTTPRRASASSAIPVLKRHPGEPSPFPHLTSPSCFLQPRLSFGLFCSNCTLLKPIVGL